MQYDVEKTWSNTVVAMVFQYYHLHAVIVLICTWKYRI